ncbi:unnamed protein product [Paramecium octaurelia]|uniref:Uncharacterized protein n=1 Tax=Paramecium octaurelia TaxID=43137 RepID=A0A8S1W4Z2_PAROT|nr:unnamed protein product [Paramecium octaurelia]
MLIKLQIFDQIWQKFFYQIFTAIWNSGISNLFLSYLTAFKISDSDVPLKGGVSVNKICKITSAGQKSQSSSYFPFKTSESYIIRLIQKAQPYYLCL